MQIEIKVKLAHRSNYGAVRSAAQIKYIAIHGTGNDGDRAVSNAIYFQSPNRHASAHYFVDDVDVYRSVDDLAVAWAVGGPKWADCKQTGGGSLYGIACNTNSISIELCDSHKDKVIQASEETIARAALLTAVLLKKYGLKLDHVIRHFDVNGKHCPAWCLMPDEWAAFKAKVKACYLTLK